MRGQAVDNEKGRHDNGNDGDLPDLGPKIEEGDGDEQRILRQRDALRRIAELYAVENGVTFSLRGCLEAGHDALMQELNARPRSRQPCQVRQCSFP